ncbi:hypothetical protein JVU11DRAFT_4761 [Chiua virens]|nr:hypothetical protein JVU11DRAFT_4761 [Chiua virens]
MSEVCLEIASSVSSASEVFFNGTEPYSKAMTHYSATSIQESACSFEPGTAEDIGVALRILARTRCPFAVKGGGHSLNPGFSSTLGVHIAMHRFTDVVYDPTTQTVVIGAGLIWDDVYAALEPYGVNVAGGRVSGIGVAGFTLGGGYAWHSNLYGLTIDMVEAFELVLPNGSAMNVTASQADLFFALKGGSNNFGIVTQFTFKTFPQTQVWGGTITYGSSYRDELTKATAEFSANNVDPKASVLTSYGYVHAGNMSTVSNLAILFYDGPTPPAGLFDAFLTNYSDTMVFTRSFSSLVASSNAQSTSGFRSAFSTISVLDYPQDFLEFMSNESITAGSKLPGFGFVALGAEPLMPTVYNFTTSPSAWPASRKVPFSPISILYGWYGDGSTDDVITQGMKDCAANLQAKASGKTDQLPLYGNYAFGDTPLEAIYGKANVKRLRNIKKQVDPENVMGLAGGFKY